MDFPSDEEGVIGPVESRALHTMTHEVHAGPFVVHCEPTEFMLNKLPSVLQSYTNTVLDLEREMEMTFRGPFHLFVYQDAEHLHRVYGQEGVGGFASYKVIHVPYDLPPRHELVHQFCTQWNDPGNTPVPQDHDATDYDAPRDKFVVEGFAEAMTRTAAYGLTMRRWLAFIIRLGAKPDLVALREQWGEPPDAVNGYWTAGTFLEFLIERYDMSRVKRWYHRRSAEVEIFGRSFQELAAEWWAWVSHDPPDPLRVARQAQDALWIEKRIGAGPLRVTVAANNLCLLYRNDAEVGGAWAFWWARTYELNLGEHDRLRVLAVNDGGLPMVWIECLRPDGTVAAGSDETWTGTDLEGCQVTLAPVAKNGGLAFPWHPSWSSQGRDRTFALRCKAVWRKD